MRDILKHLGVATMSRPGNQIVIGTLVGAVLVLLLDGFGLVPLSDGAPWATAVAGVTMGLAVGTSVATGRRIVRRRRNALLIVPPEQGWALVSAASRPGRHVDDGARDDAYVARTSDAVIREALVAPDGLVVLHGPALSGTTTTAAHHVSELFGDYHVLAPRPVSDDGRPALPELLADPQLTAGRRRWVLWLDGFGDFLAAGGVEVETIDGWLRRHPDARAVATMSSADLVRFQGGTSPEARVLAHSRLEALAARSPAAEASLARYRQARVPHGPADALVKFAAHWRRAGLTRGVPVEALRAAVQRYAELAPDTEVVDFDEELKWALEAEGDARPLIEPAGPEAYRAPEYVVEAVERESVSGGMVPRAALRLISRAIAARPQDQLQVGRALLRRGQRGEAEYFFGLAAGQSVRPNVARLAREALHRLDTGGGARAVRAVSRPEPSGPPPIVPWPSIAQRQSVRELRSRRAPGDPDAELFSIELEGTERGHTMYRHVVRRAVLRITTLALMDVLAIAAAMALSLAVSVQLGHTAASDAPDDLKLWISVAGPITPLVAGALGLYRADAERARLTLIVAMVSGVVVVATPIVLLHGATIHTGLGIPTRWAAAVLLDWAARSLYDRVSRYWVHEHKLRARVVVFGPGDQARAVARILRDGGVSRPMQIIGYVAPTREASLSCLGSYVDFDQAHDVRAVGRRLADFYVQRVIIVDDGLDMEAKARMAERAHAEGFAVELFPRLPELVLGMASLVDGDIPLVRIRPLELPPESRALKRAMDVTVLIATSWLWLPLLGVLSLWSMATLGHGSPFAYSERVRKGGQTFFTMLRVRTRREPGHAPSRFGRLLENSGLDELAQLLNVAGGTMSLVGPRPLPRQDDQQLSDIARRRRYATPGITGLWQVSASRSARADDMLGLDVLYLSRWSVFLDMAILLRTFRAVTVRTVRGSRHNAD